MIQCLSVDINILVCAGFLKFFRSNVWSCSALRCLMRMPKLSLKDLSEHSSTHGVHPTRHLFLLSQMPPKCILTGVTKVIANDATWRHQKNRLRLTSTFGVYAWPEHNTQWNIAPNSKTLGTSVWNHHKNQAHPYDHRIYPKLHQSFYPNPFVILNPAVVSGTFCWFNTSIGKNQDLPISLRACLTYPPFL